MVNENGVGGVDRRKALGLLGGATLAGTAMAKAQPIEAEASSAVEAWDATVDVVIAGSGAAGISAAIEAARAGLEVLVLEKFNAPGGSSGMSGGVSYLGGGTALQKALGYNDTVDAMFDYILAASGPHPHVDKVQLYCESAVGHFDWLVANGVPYKQEFTGAKGLPFGDQGLYYSGSELAHPFSEKSIPAPRGHVPHVMGHGGWKLMEALTASAKSLGVKMIVNASAERIVQEIDGRVAGVIIDEMGTRKKVKTRRGVVLACGGFVQNREMIAKYAPELADITVPWGSAGDLGEGIRMGLGAGGEAIRMNQALIVVSIYPPVEPVKAILVNRAGLRFVSEDYYHCMYTHAITMQPDTQAYLVTDQETKLPAGNVNIDLVATATTIAELEAKVGLPDHALQGTVSYYNRNARGGRDPLYGKKPAYLRPLQTPPYYAYDVNPKSAFCPHLTFGGLHTSVNAQVLSTTGEPVPGLYAAGRTTSGLPSSPYIASGISVGDCAFFGRQAGKALGGGA